MTDKTPNSANTAAQGHSKRGADRYLLVRIFGELLTLCDSLPEAIEAGLKVERCEWSSELPYITLSATFAKDQNIVFVGRFIPSATAEKVMGQLAVTNSDGTMFYRPDTEYSGSFSTPVATEPLDFSGTQYASSEVYPQPILISVAKNLIELMLDFSERGMEAFQQGRLTELDGGYDE